MIDGICFRAGFYVIRSYPYSVLSFLRLSVCCRAICLGMNYALLTYVVMNFCLCPLLAGCKFSFVLLKEWSSKHMRRSLSASLQGMDVCDGRRNLVSTDAYLLA